MERAQFVFTTKADGDVGLACQGASDLVCPEVALRRRRVVDRPWSWLRQVHSNRVVRVREPGGAAGAEADAAFTTDAGVCLCAFGADCAPVVLIGEGGYGIAHAGWLGARRGVVLNLVGELRAAGVHDLVAHIGPTIGPECYEFGAELLDELAQLWGDGVRATTSDGKPALDLAAALRVQLDSVDVPLLSVGPCTSCSPEHFSFRAQRSTGRHAGVVWA